MSVNLPGPFFFFFFDEFCFLCQLNCSDLFFFFDEFCFLCQLLLDRCIMHQVHTSMHNNYSAVFRLLELIRGCTLRLISEVG